MLLPPDEHALLQLFRTLPDADRAALLTLARGLAGAQPLPPPPRDPHPKPPLHH